MTVRYYSSVAPPTTLSAGITAGSASIQVGSTTGFPALTPYTLSVDYGTSGEELVQVNSVGGTTLAVTRGIDGTSATSHNAGAVIRHVSSARDFADSRTHENSDSGVHGLDPSEELVGTEKTQTLSNKTLDMAEGTLNRVDIFNNDGWMTTVNGDADFPLVNLQQWKPTPSDPFVINIQNNGTINQANTAAVDADPTIYRYRIVDASNDTRFHLLSGGKILNKLANGQNGIEIQEGPDGARWAAFRTVTDSGSQVRSVLFTDGTAYFSGKTTTPPTLEVRAVPSQTGRLIKANNSGGTEVFYVTPSGAVTTSSTITGNSVTGATVTGTTSVSSPTFTNTTYGQNLVPVQRGKLNISFAAATSFTQVVNFPTAYSAIPNVFTNINSGDGEASQWSSRAYNITNTSFTLLLYRNFGAPAIAWSNQAVQWAATPN